MKELDLVKEYCDKYELPIFKHQVGKRILGSNIHIKTYINKLVEADERKQIIPIAKASANVVYAILAKVIECDISEYFKHKTMFETDLLCHTKEEALRDLLLDEADNNYLNLANMLWDIEEYISLVGLFNPFDRIFEEVHRCHMLEGREFRPLVPEEFDPNKSITYVIPDLSFLN